jgi:hypothetical protein
MDLSFTKASCIGGGIGEPHTTTNHSSLRKAISKRASIIETDVTKELDALKLQMNKMFSKKSTAVHGQNSSKGSNQELSIYNNQLN